MPTPSRDRVSGQNEHVRHAVRCGRTSETAGRRPRKFATRFQTFFLRLVFRSIRTTDFGSVNTTAGITRSNALALTGDDFDGDGAPLWPVREKNAPAMSPMA